MKYSRDRDLFKVIGQELTSVRDWLPGVCMSVHPIGFDYWETVLLYTSSVLNPNYHSAEELVALFAEKLSKNKEEVMRTIAQQIERRIKPQLARRLRREVEESVMQQEKLEIAKSMLAKGREMSLIQEVIGREHPTIKKLS